MAGPANAVSSNVHVVQHCTSPHLTSPHVTVTGQARTAQRSAPTVHVVQNVLPAAVQYDLHAVDRRGVDGAVAIRHVLRLTVAPGHSAEQQNTAQDTPATIMARPLLPRGSGQGAFSGFSVPPDRLHVDTWA